VDPLTSTAAGLGSKWVRRVSIKNVAEVRDRPRVSKRPEVWRGGVVLPFGI